MAESPWMTDEILLLMDERRAWKGRNEQEYKNLNRIIHRECKNAKERWLEKRCSEIEDLEKRDQQIMYSKVKDLLGRKSNKKNIAIKTADGKVAMEVEEVKTRWSKYIAELFFDIRPDSDEIRIDN